MDVIGAGREVLERIAARQGIDGVIEIARLQEEGAPPEREDLFAFDLLSFGLPFYREMSHHQYFPATSSKARRRGSRAVRASLPGPDAERAVIFMTHSVPAYAMAFWQCQAQQGEIDDPGIYEQYHGSIRDLLQKHYPLDQLDEIALADARSEVDVFSTGVPVHIDWRGGPATAFGMRLEEGDDPSGDVDLIKSHVIYALHDFRVRCLIHALRVGLPLDDYNAVRDDVLVRGAVGRGELLWQVAIGTYWDEIMGDYFEYVRPGPVD
jgi:hypothetical protein